MQFLPICFTACKHPSNASDYETDGSDTSHNQPPDVIADVLRDQAKDQGANNAYEAGGSAQYDADPQNRHRKDEPFEERSSIIKVEFYEVKGKKSRRDCPDER